MSSSDDRWFVQTLDGSNAEVTGALDIDTEGGIVRFLDSSGDVDAFLNFGATAFGYKITEEDE